MSKPKKGVEKRKERDGTRKSWEESDSEILKLHIDFEKKYAVKNSCLLVSCTENGITNLIKRDSSRMLRLGSFWLLGHS